MNLIISLLESKDKSSYKTNQDPLKIVDKNSSWYKIRKGLIKELGYEIDKAWFSKARVKEDKEMKTLTLSMPTKFMADWIQSRYGHIVYRFATSLGFKFIEYTD